jgi:hypothetical protein
MSEDPKAMKWLWKMKWCEKRGLHPGEKCNWEHAERVWNESRKVKQKLESEAGND